MMRARLELDRISQIMRARLERTSESNQSNNESFGSLVRTPQSCIQSDVFVCSSILKHICSFLLKERRTKTVSNC